MFDFSTRSEKIHCFLSGWLQRKLPRNKKDLLFFSWAHSCQSLPFQVTALFITMAVPREISWTQSQREMRLQIPYGRLLTRQSTLFFVALLAVVLHDSFVAFHGHLCHFAEAAAHQGSCTSQGTSSPMQVCTCNVPEQGETSDHAVVVSAEKNQLMAKCAIGTVTLPVDLMEKQVVCPAGMTDPQSCVSPSGTIPFASLLSGDGASAVAWVGDEVNYAAVLQVPKQNLPPVDKEFIVGCTQEGKGHCLLHVTLSARASSKDSQAVTCAYGSASNADVHRVTVSPKDPTFTLDCSSDGIMQPASFTTSYCPATGPLQENCDEKYASILQGYSSSWWQVSQAGTSNKAVLTIPHGNFPEAQKKVLVGCKASTAIPNSTLCTVELTITSSSPSSAWLLSLSVTMTLAVAGAVSSLV
ncbi:SAG-related sequence SRS51 [Toxoplasma gondii TgCatPRC2]|uniref:SAG-related sequence SRS51 n=1 Tax=Toxoplasma gondii TgCatPRC2 TaxID=1130821 RepID=A0A151HLJ0_TOXGO|nr:SAG-related sequence SRS51 [Toxoplasma gondii TgCatPRC2]